MTIRNPLLLVLGAASAAIAAAACVPEAPDLTPPAPPVVTSNPPQLTSTATLELFGTTEPGTTVRYTVRGGAPQDADVSGASWSATIPLVNGTNGIAVFALDEYENESEPAIVDVTADLAAPDPVSVIRTPVDRTSVPDGVPVVRWHETQDNPPDVNFGVAEYEVTIAPVDTSLGPVLTRVVTVGSSAEYVLVLDTTLSAGWHTLTIRAEDAIGNVSVSSVPRRFFVGAFGDANGDGNGDFTAGAPGHDASSVNGDDAGRAFLWHGAQPVDTTADLTRTGGDHLGATVAVVHDLDGDHRAEVVFASPAANTLDLYLGGTGAAVPITFSGAFGSAIASGDVNGDGLAELFVGAPNCQINTTTAPGCVRIFVGTTAGFSGSSYAAFEGMTANEDFGASVAFAGDLDGDGAVEIAIGAPNADSAAGRVYLFSLPSLPAAASVTNAASASAMLVAPGGAAGDRFGAALAGGRDADGDGLPDLVAGAPDDGTGGNGSGRVFVIHGIGEGTCEVSGAAVAGTRAGASVALIGAFDASRTTSAIAIGAPATSSNAGAVRVLVENPSSTDRCSYVEASVTGAAGSRLGTSVSPAGDIGADGAADFVAGAPGANDVIVYVGGTNLTLTRATTIEPSVQSATTLPLDPPDAGASVSGLAP